ITNISMDNFFCKACPLQKGDKQCKKKVKENGNGSWLCSSCNRQVQKYDYSYALRIDLKDPTGELQSVTAFDEIAELIMGVAASDLHILTIDEDATSEII
ncbi:hypothetical protein KI387_040480, partial [Taxus chinensis]